jgi:HEPN domain-containing protein
MVNRKKTADCRMVYIHLKILIIRLNSHPPNEIAVKDLLKLYEQEPIKNIEGIYKTIMIPRKNFIKTWIYE